MAARWYVVHVYSGFESKIKAAIMERAEKIGLADKFEDILVPTEEVTEIKRGQKVASERKFYPGYVLVRMEMSDDTWHLVKDTPKVTGFLGGGGKPLPISDREAQSVIAQVQESVEKPKQTIKFDVGEQVRVADGPFASFNGTVETVDEARSRVKVSVSIFGRATPVELDFSQVEKL